MTRRLPVATGCGEDWSAMPPSAGGRRCARCDHVVLDLRGRSLREARVLLRAQRAASGSACARVDVDAETREPIFAPEPRPPPSRSVLYGVAVAAALAAGCESVSYAETRAPPAAVLTPAPTLPAPSPALSAPPRIADGPDGGARDAGSRRDAAPSPHHRPRHTRPPVVHEEWMGDDLGNL